MTSPGQCPGMGRGGAIRPGLQEALKADKLSGSPGRGEGRGGGFLARLYTTPSA